MPTFCRLCNACGHRIVTACFRIPMQSSRGLGMAICPAFLQARPLPPTLQQLPFRAISHPAPYRSPTLVFACDLRPTPVYPSNVPIDRIGLHRHIPCLPSGLLSFYRPVPGPSAGHPQQKEAGRRKHVLCKNMLVLKPEQRAQSYRHAHLAQSLVPSFPVTTPGGQ